MLTLMRLLEPAAAEVIYTPGGITVTDGSISTDLLAIQGDETFRAQGLVTGEGSAWLLGGNWLRVDHGDLAVSEGAALTSGDALLNHFAETDGDATMTVTGAGSTWTVEGGISLAGNKADPGTMPGHARLSILDGAGVASGGAMLGHAAGGTGVVEVSGAGSKWVVSTLQGWFSHLIFAGLPGDIYVGYHGTGFLTVSDGGAVESVDGNIGHDRDAHGTVMVTGAGSTWDVAGTLRVGRWGEGKLTIADGGRIASVNANVGGLDVAVGRALVTGAGSALLVSGESVSIGNQGHGTMTIADGGLVQVGAGVDGGGHGGILTVAAEATAVGVLNFGAAAGEQAVAAGTLDVGTLKFGAGTGTVVFNHTGATYDFSSAITGTGRIESYSGVTRLSGDLSDYTGAVDIRGGTLAFNTAFAGAVSVLDGGALGGSGTLSNVTLESGATVAPGNSIGTLTVSGDFGFVAGTTYAVEVDSAGNSDLVHVTGAAIIDSGATVTVKAESGNPSGATYAPDTVYTILTADTGVTGSFGAVSDGFAFLDAALGYDAHNVYLTLTRNGVDFADLAGTPNQVATAGGLQSPGDGDLVDAVAALPEGEPAQAFDQLSGEVHAALAQGLIDRSRLIRDTVEARIAGSFEEPAPRLLFNTDDMGSVLLTLAPAQAASVWGSSFGDWSGYSGDGNGHDFSIHGSGLIFGADAHTDNGWLVGLAAGYGRDRLAEPALGSSAGIDGYHVSGYAAGAVGAARLSFGAAYGRHEIETSRQPAFTGFDDSLSADYSAATTQVFAEISSRIGSRFGMIEHFINLAHVNLQVDGFAEQGGVAALTGGAQDYARWLSTAGIRASRDLQLAGKPARLSADLGWRHGYGDRSADAVLAFAGGERFQISAAAISREAVLAGLGLELNLGASAAISFSASGALGQGTNEQSIRGQLAVRF
ncbi:T5SS/PEP-CTERM-associated repeat protein [Hoeflea marina]|uniref:T5SS/PEP-CTERM-associated repeat protein n=1 Tax=Hoeflea marina TaxID=274592 RepID=A0A317PCC4_9HYPH|nr:T5SS/PEP-CTERM-associated repeat protein [Hoeflea marina]